MALEQLKKAAGLMPDDPTIYEHLGDVYFGKNMKSEAREEWLKALELDVKNEKLVDKFKEAGFGDPYEEERVKGKLEEYKKKKLIQEQEDVPPVEPPSIQDNHLMLHSTVSTS